MTAQTKKISLGFTHRVKINTNVFVKIKDTFVALSFSFVILFIQFTYVLQNTELNVVVF